MKNWKLELTFSVEECNWLKIKETKASDFPAPIDDCKISPMMANYDPTAVVRVARIGDTSAKAIEVLQDQFQALFPGSKLIEAHASEKE